MSLWPTDHFYAEAHEAIFPQHQAETRFLLDRAERYGAPILDVGCGSGRLLVALAEAGHWRGVRHRSIGYPVRSTPEAA